MATHKLAFSGQKYASHSNILFGQPNIGDLLQDTEKPQRAHEQLVKDINKSHLRSEMVKFK